MRSPRVRFTVRGLMVAVAVAAIMIEVGRAFQPQRLYLERATFHVARARAYEDLIDRFIIDGLVVDLEGDEDYPVEPPWPEQIDRMIPYHAALARKYERAARYPWLPVEPDPPRRSDLAGRPARLGFATEPACRKTSDRVAQPRVK